LPGRKPRLRGKQKITSRERDADFWMNALGNELPMEIWESEAMVMSLARYFAHERIANVELLSRIASTLPLSVRDAVRNSELVLCQSSPRRTELGQLAACHPDIAALFRVLDIFELASRERLALLDHLKTRCRAVAPFRSACRREPACVRAPRPSLTHTVT